MKSGFSGMCSVLALLCSGYSFAMNPGENQPQPIFFRREMRNQRHVTFSLQEARANLHGPTISNQEEPKNESDTDDSSILNLNKISVEELSQYKSFYNVRNLEIGVKHLLHQEVNSLLKLSALPLQQLQSLKIVGDMGENKLIRKNLNDLLAETPQLRELNLSGNKLKIFPKAICRLQKLEILNISKNPQLKKLPQSLWKSPNLREVTVNADLVSLNQVPEYVELLKNEEMLTLLNSHRNKHKLNNSQIEFTRNNLHSCKVITINGCHWNDGIQAWVKPSSKNSSKIVKLKNMSLANALIDYIRGKEHWKAAENLMTYGVDIGAVDIDSPDKYGIPMLIKAAESGRLKVVQYLVDHGADIHVRTKFENTALMGASLFGHLDIVKYLVSRGANVNDRNAGGETALMRAAGQRHLGIVKHLLQNGADINVQDRFGGTALMKGAYYGSLRIVKYLTEHGADISIRDNNQNTVLMRTVLEGQLNIVKYLINRGANVNDRNKDGETALMKAIKEEQFRVVRCLAENNANASITDNNGKTALYFAQERLEKAIEEDKPKHQEIVKLLESRSKKTKKMIL